MPGKDVLQPDLPNPIRELTETRHFPGSLGEASPKTLRVTRQWKAGVGTMFGVREKLLSRWVKVLSSRLKVERTPDDGRAGLVLPVLNVGRGLCQMQSAKVLIMPKPTPDHAARLRSYENPPYPQFSIDVLREVTKAFSDEISPIREDIGGLKYGVNLMQSELKSYGQRLRTIEEDVSTIRARVTTSMKTAGWIVAGIVTLIAIAANLLQLYQYFHPHS